MNVTEYLRTASEFLAHRKGLPVLIGVGMVALNVIVTFLPPWPLVGWLDKTDLLLQLGVIVGLLGVLLGDAL
jgi:hypothetical protein